MLNQLTQLLKHIDVGYLQLAFESKINSTDKRFFIKDANRKFIDFMKLSMVECVGKDALEVIPATESYWFEIMNKVAIGDETASFEGYNSSESLYFKIKGYRLDGDQIALLVYDLTDHVKFEEDLKERNEEINAQNEEFRALNEELTESYETLNTANEQLIIKEKAVEESEKMLKMVLDHIPVRVFWKDLESNYLGCNRNFAMDAGKSSDEEIIGHTDLDFFAKDIGNAFRIDDRLVMDTGKAKLNFEESQNQAGEETRFLRTNKVPLVNDLDEVIGVLGTYEDITPLKKIQKELIEAKEKAEESDRLKSAFLANMSHEIRTPMNGIVGFAQLLNDVGVTDEKRAYYINIINDSSQQLLRIVNDIIDISKIEAGQLDLHEEYVNFEKLLGDSINVYSAVANNKGLQLKVNNTIDPQKCNLFVDGTKLRQIIDNLLSNAIKFTHKGSVEISSVVDSDLLKISVADTGIGVSEAHYQLIFDRFHQVGDLDKQKEYGGTGLGLSICLGLIKKMGGTIWVESTLGEGSDFHVELPVKCK